MARGGARPNAGRKRKAPELKALAGTVRTDRENVLGEPAPDGPMIAPLHLSDLAQLHFGSIAKMLEEQERASPHYAEHVALLALRLEQIQRYQAVLEVEGDTYETETATGSILIRARPEVAMLSDAMRHAQSLIGELMLNPAAALRIASGHKPEAGAFDDF
ncbi:MAG: P27 family phage terminase small subunit [Sphingomonadales bacterium]|nr:P27 family phage terminase small subunit [Sphingomonadales bacterium]